MVWGTYRFRKHTTLQNGKKWPKKKVPQSARLSAGGVQSLFGQCPNIGGINSKGCSLNIYLIIWIKYHLYPKRLISKNKPSLIELEYISRWTSFLLFPPNCKSYFAKFPSRRYWLWKAAGSHFKFHNKPAWLKCFEQSGMN